MASALAWAFTRMALASPERERQAQGSLRWPHPGGLSSQVPRPAPQRACGLRPSCRGRGGINRSSFPLPREEWVQRGGGRRPGPSINQAQHSWSRPLGRSPQPKCQASLEKGRDLQRLGCPKDVSSWAPISSVLLAHRCQIRAPHMAEEKSCALGQASLQRAVSALAVPAASLIRSVFSASEARIWACFFPSATLMADSRIPSDSKTVALLRRSAST